MHPSVLKFFRLYAFTAALGGVILLALGYNLLPAEIPLTRWSSSAKSPLLVLRVPLINLLSLLLLVLLVLLERSLVRAHAASPYRDNAMMALTALFATLGTKSFLEAFELLILPTMFPWLPWMVLLVVAGGLGLAALTGLPLLRKGTAPRASFTPGEKLGAVLVVPGIVGLEFAPLWSRPG